jgi:hypothetical protein
VDQYTGVSTTISPVTHTAEVDVNIAVRTDALPGPTVATGSNSRPAPTRIANENATATSCAG